MLGLKTFASASSNFQGLSNKTSIGDLSQIVKNAQETFFRTLHVVDQSLP
jgi:hypothetical protein